MLCDHEGDFNSSIVKINEQRRKYIIPVENLEKPSSSRIIR